MDDRPNRTTGDRITGIVLDDYAAAAAPAPTGNRKERRTMKAKARSSFKKYKVHMQTHGYDATFNDFLESMP